MTTVLIGMLDSPFVRRVAIGLQLLGLPFEHRSISVFRGYEQFRTLNPVVKAPTLVCDDGTVLMDSSLMIDYAEALARPRSRWPAAIGALRHDLRLTGLALAACEKTAQIIYERGLRPAEKVHTPWLDRVGAQLRAAYDGLEQEIAAAPPAVDSDSLTHGAVAAAVAWHFTQRSLPGQLDAAAFPALQAYSTQAEALPEFARAPWGEGVYPAR